MDSRLLNVFHEDPFDGEYIKYENNAEFWSSGPESIDLQLTETLHGILPLESTQNGEIYGKREFFSNDEIEASSALQTETEIVYDDLVDHNFVDEDNMQIITLNANGDYYDRDDLSELDGRSQYSEATFRTRTDSSSIGDYESHTSDYDDDDDDEVFDGCSIKAEFEKEKVVENGLVVSDMQQTNDFAMGMLAPDLFLDTNSLDDDAEPKSRTVSINTIGYDVDGLGLQIDGSTFDLAEFITKDDFTLNAATASNAGSGPKSGVRKRPTQRPTVFLQNVAESDSDSDVMVDVETVENDGLEKTLLIAQQAFLTAEVFGTGFVDNVKEDPSWNPKQITKKSGGTVKESIANTATKPGKAVKGKKDPELQSSIAPSSKLKFVCGRGKNLKLLRTGSKSSKKCAKDEPVIVAAVENKLKGKSVPEKTEKLPTPSKAMSSDATITDPSRLVDPRKIQWASQQKVEPTAAKADPAPVKRKLNLEEYKLRRGGLDAKKAKVEQQPTSIATKSPVKNGNSPIAIATKHSEAVTAIVKTLKEQTSQKPITDPITEAKNKVLRMQELKRQQQLKIIDSTIQAKVSRVTKILPLQEIVGKAEEPKRMPVKLHSDYEQIVMVSASCNTEISLLDSGVHNASRSLLNTSKAINKLQAESVKISSNSLIASIQGVVVQKALPIYNNPAIAKTIAKNADGGEQHGEDKVIIYLHKDTIRKQSYNIATQTDFQPEFPPLPLPKCLAFKRKSREHMRRRAYRKRHLEELSSSNSSDELDSNSSSSSRTSSSPTSRSSKSPNRLRNGNTTGSHSSPSSRRHRSSISSSDSELDETKRSRRQRKSNYKQRAKKHARSSSSSSLSDYSGRRRTRSRSPLRRHSRSRSRSYSPYNHRGQGNYNRSYRSTNVSEPAVEERRIVYVGRIEEETTREMLRRKFSVYGPIKQITIHYKDTGTKYGFVTFDRSQDAFNAIDNGTRDPHIKMYDISFGGRRAFCGRSYADLDNAGINTYHSYVFPRAVAPPPEEDSFEALLLKVKAKMNANKSSNGSNVADKSATAPSKI